MATDVYTGLALPIVVLALLWPLASILFAVAYPAIMPRLPSSPRQRSVALQFLCMAPALMSLALTASVFSSAMERRLVALHCHPGSECPIHVPAVASGLSAWVCMGLASLLAALTLFYLVREATRMRQLGRGLNALADSSLANVRMIPSAELLAFSAGLLRPTVFVSQGLAQQTSSEELEAIVQHERAHGRRRDNLRDWLASLCTWGWPSEIRRDLLREVRLAAEQCCDAAAARAVSDPLLVAHTLVKVQKLARRPADIACGFTGSSIEARVSALLQLEASRGSSGPLVSLLAIPAGVAGVVVLATDPLHHLVEMVLDWLQRLAL